jgi:plasmid stabilization system protein ParE
MRGYVLHPQAFSDIDEIWEFIAKDSLDAADRVIGEIHDGIQSLVKTPGQGHTRPDLTSRPLRFWLVHSYLIAYVPEHPLVVVGVIHGRRNPKMMAAILKGRE